MNKNAFGKCTHNAWPFKRLTAPNGCRGASDAGINMPAVLAMGTWAKSNGLEIQTTADTCNMQSPINTKPMEAKES